MKLSDFDYQLPEELIATEPMNPRDHSRLLVMSLYNTECGGCNTLLPLTKFACSPFVVGESAPYKVGAGRGSLEHRYFYDIIDYLNPGDVLVLNNSKVFPARLIGHKESGGEVEVFLHNRINTPSQPSHSPRHSSGQAPGEGENLPALIERSESKWNCLLKGRVHVGLKIKFDQGLECILKSDNHDGTWMVEFNLAEAKMMQVVKRIGQVPIPPYIEKARAHNSQLATYNANNLSSRPTERSGEICGHDNRDDGFRIKSGMTDMINYQTVFASDDKLGSVAAPTAGLHFTSELMKKIEDKGVKIVYVTLHVGLGTFASVKTNNIEEHQMHSEYVEMSAEVIREVLNAKKANKKIIAVGTTSVRTLESAFKNFDFKNYLKIKNYKIENYVAWTNIFIYPGYEFKIVDAMITNFHLPKSSLIMLISALAGHDNIMRAYEEAVRERYRFYSFGDAMLIMKSDK